MMLSAMLSALALVSSLPSVPSSPGPLPETAFSASRSHMVTACAAVPKARIEAAVRRALDTGQTEHGRFESTCNYSAGDLSVALSVRSLTQTLDLSAELGNLQAAFPGSKLRAVKGLGGPAFALDIPGAGTQIHLLPDAREYLLVSVLGDTQRGAAEAAVKIALAAIHARTGSGRRYTGRVKP